MMHGFITLRCITLTSATIIIRPILNDFTLHQMKRATWIFPATFNLIYQQFSLSTPHRLSWSSGHALRTRCAPHGHLKKVQRSLDSSATVDWHKFSFLNRWRRRKRKRTEKWEEDEAEEEEQSLRLTSKSSHMLSLKCCDFINLFVFADERQWPMTFLVASYRQLKSFYSICVAFARERRGLRLFYHPAGETFNLRRSISELTV